ncbi:MAG: hemerythrin domain-containing protein [Thermoanaerobaculia bacterium]
MPETMTDQWVAQVLEEHEHLRELICDLKSFLEVPRPKIGEKGAHTWSSELSKRLVTLHDELFRHFRFEEEGGMVEELSVAHPRFADRIDEVVSEHPQMLKAVRNIMVDALSYSEGEKPEDPQLRRRVIAVLDQLAEHECKETDLIQRAEYRDTGAAD